jgi:ferritin-like metal-binding protein YciE
MATPQENLLDWLRDAHAMEQQAEKMLKAQSERLEHYPKLKARIDFHIQEMLGQQKLIEECLSRLGGSSSTIKNMTGKLMAFGQAVGGSLMSDEVIKGAMAGYVFENVEIAAYAVLIADHSIICSGSSGKSVGNCAASRNCLSITRGAYETASGDYFNSTS